MIPQYNNYLLASTLVWLDHLFLDRGQAFYNVSTPFYPVNSNFTNVHFYSSPYKQFVYDQSITGATLITGIYLNNNYISSGTSGFLGINYEEGAAMFSSVLPANSIVSGNYGVKEISIKTIAEPDERLLYSKAYYTKNRPLSISGNLTNEQPLPVIYVRFENGKNEEFVLGGEEISSRTIILTVLAESQFQLDNIKGLMLDQTRSYIPVCNLEELPFDNMYRLKSGFNYTGMACNKINTNQAAFISDVSIYNYDSNIMNELRSINSALYPAVINIETKMARFPRA